MNRAGLILLVVAMLGVAGCAGVLFQQPTITVKNVSVQNFNLTSADLLIYATVHNPNPIGATLTKITYNIYYLRNGEFRFLGSGERGGFQVPAQANVTLGLPVTVTNAEVVRTTAQALREGSVTVLVNGTASLDLGITTFDIPYNQTQKVNLTS